MADMGILQSAVRRDVLGMFQVDIRINFGDAFPVRSVSLLRERMQLVGLPWSMAT